MSNCGCGSIQHVSSGGFKFGGSAVIVWDQREGGIVFGGSATVQNPNDVFDGYLLACPLNEPEAPYHDYSRTERDLVSESSPESSEGVYCLPSLHFTRENGVGQLVSFVKDDHQGSLSFSCWINLEDTFREKGIFSRGYRNNGNETTFSVSTSFINHLVCSVVTDSGSFAVYSSKTLETGRWYHIAAVYSLDRIQLFVNGIADNQIAVTGIPFRQNNDGFVGSRDRGAYLTGNIQEVRLSSEVKDSAWFKAERKNYCGGLVVTGGEESVVTAV